MLSTTDLLAHALTGKENLDQCSTAELEQLINRYPYFPASRLLLARKEGKSQVSSVYFSNPLWVSQWLKPAGEATITAPANAETTEPVNIIHSGETPASIAEPATVITEPVAVTPEISSVQTNDINSATEAVSTEQPSLSVVELSENATQEEETGVDQTAEDADYSAEGGEASESADTENTILSIPQIKIEPVNPDQALVFEPYHTVDYFAAVGIKNPEQDKSGDQFGKQLRRFTDWLKVMKRLPATELEKQSDPKAEQKVEQLAGQSLDEKEVLTEAMAEVWVKQGNPGKAREIYRKLSLLDPSKSAYFASLIDELK